MILVDLRMERGARTAWVGVRCGGIGWRSEGEGREEMV